MRFNLPVGLWVIMSKRVTAFLQQIRPIHFVSGLTIGLVCYIAFCRLSPHFIRQALWV